MATYLPNSRGLVGPAGMFMASSVVRPVHSRFRDTRSRIRESVGHILNQARRAIFRPPTSKSTGFPSIRVDFHDVPARVWGGNEPECKGPILPCSSLQSDRNQLGWIEFK